MAQLHLKDYMNLGFSNFGNLSILEVCRLLDLTCDPCINVIVVDLHIANLLRYYNLL
jgi:hypothetical protein